jgi:inorganic pyrophosphatase
MDISRIPVGPHPPRRIYALVEIPKGGRNKYEYDFEMEAFRLDRVLYSAVHYPAAYGFVPRTKAEDGDPLDILVVTSEPTFPGCVIEARPVGLFKMSDEHGDDVKILAVPMADPHYSQITELDHVAPHFLREVEHFFRIYKDLEGKVVQTRGWDGRSAAERTILEAMAAAGS